MEREVWITGIGVVSPIGGSTKKFWDAALRGVSGTTALTSLHPGIPAELESRVVARAADIPAMPGGYEGGRLAWLADRAAAEAMADAGLRDLTGAVTGLVFGTATGGTANLEQGFLAMTGSAARHPSKPGPALWKDMVFDACADRLASRLALDGPSITLSTGCTAGVDAVGHAFEMVRFGEADIVLVGASDAPLCPVVFAAFDVLGALTKRCKDPAGASRPFDKDRDGFVLGEGAAFLVLELAASAAERRMRPYAAVSGFASMSNAQHMTDLPPHSEVLSDCFGAALDDARILPNQIDHVNAHGSSTPQNDICETNAIKAVLGEHARQISVNSLKSMIGHALGASNALEIAACALSLRDQIHYPTINLAEPGPGCDLDYLANRCKPGPCRHIAKLSNGFSGIHSTLILSAVEGAVS